VISTCGEFFCTSSLFILSVFYLVFIPYPCFGGFQVANSIGEEGVLVLCFCFLRSMLVRTLCLYVIFLCKSAYFLVIKVSLRLIVEDVIDGNLDKTYHFFCFVSTV